MALDLSKFLVRFVEEAREQCARLSDGLLTLEQAEDRTEAIQVLFRAAHTLKGSSRMMKLPGISALAHSMEDVLDGLRMGRIPFSPALSDALFRGTDALSGLVDRVGTGETLEAPAALCQQLARIAAGAPEGPAAPESPAPEAAAPTPQAPELRKDTPAAAPGKAEYLRIHAGKMDDLVQLMGEMVSEHARFRKEILHLRDVERSAAQCLGPSSGLRSGLDPEVARAALHQAVRSVSDAVLMQDYRIVELQASILTMRMQPLSTVFEPLRRTVRDLAHEHGKEIEFLVEGGETELDRKIIERIGDPILHMIRNALDHGLEGPEERAAAGKPARGRLVLSAFYAGGSVTIMLQDDGRGIPVEKIREKALGKRMFDAEALSRMSRAELLNLIFLPGFSTSPIITDLSGRGVGMDVVRKNIVDDLRGAITIETEEGRGTTFLLRLPLNLAVFPLFLLAVGQKTCAIPATSIVEMLTIAPGEIIQIMDKRAVRLREQIIPVEDLALLLGLREPAPAAASEVMIIIVQNGEEKLGLIVDDILGQDDMVVKPLPAHLKSLKLVTGVTLGAGNRVINVLHVPELLEMTRHLEERSRPAPAAEERRGASILVVDDSLNTREIERGILEAYGYEVDVAEDGLAAIERTHSRLYDLVITDVEMPRLDGFSLTERLRADDRYRHVPIIIVTSRAKDEDRKRGIQVGADAYILKGAFDQSSLLGTVRNLIG
jgi:chemotaxis protein histidine kinase CheA